MNRIEKTFKNLDRSVLVTFVMAGDPVHDVSKEVVMTLANSGADLIEIGMPFTDPAADGLAIQKAGQRALAAGANMDRTFDLVKALRAVNNDTPVILMGYANPVFARGWKRFAEEASEAGVDGLIIVDLPPEEGSDLREALQGKNIDLIRLVTPVTDERRLKVLLDGASGFLYYVSITGVTGSAKPNPDDLKPHIDAIKAHTDLPVVVGFGIRTPEDAEAMGKIADGVVVGSAIVSTIEQNPDDRAPALIGAQVSALAAALK